jgi:UPF0176 protein
LIFLCLLAGGIRCEKATAHVQRLLRRRGEAFASSSGDSVEATAPEVYHLEGGILAYLDAVPPEESMFDGECYVFDNRVAVGHGLAPTAKFRACRACRRPLPVEDEHEGAGDGEAGRDPGAGSGSGGAQASDGGGGVGESPGGYREGIQCRHCAADPDRQARRGRYEMRHRQMLAAERRGGAHLGSSSTEAARMREKRAAKKPSAS